MIKNNSLLKRKPGLSHKDFFQYWNKNHGPLAAKVIPGLRKYVQGHAVRREGMEYHCDGITELWFDGIDEVENYLSWRETEKARELIEDENKFIDKIQFVRVFAEEKVILGQKCCV